MIQPRQIATTAFAVLLVVGLVGAAVAPAAATHNDTDDGGLTDALSPAEEGNAFDTVKGAVKGYAARVSYKISSFRNDTPAAENSKQAALEEFNQNSANYVSYLNDRDVHNGEVVEIEFKQSGETATMYIVGDFNETTDQYDSAEAVNTTDRTVDHEITLRGMAADNAADELERFNDEFAEPGDDLTNSYVSEMAAKYGSSVDEPFTGGN